MNKFVILTVLLFSLCTHANDHYRTEYYRALPFKETPYPKLRGVYQMSAEEAETNNHYAFYFDKQNRLSKVTFGIGNTLKNPEDYWYTEPDALMAPVTTISFEENRETHHFFNVNGMPVYVGDVFKQVFYYDKKVRTRMEFQDRAGEVVNNQNNVSYYTWTTLENGDVIENRYNTEGELQPTRPRFEYETVKLSFNSDGLLALIQNIDPKTQQLRTDSTGAAQNSFLYNEFGNFIKWVVMNEKGEAVIGTSGVAYENQFYQQAKLTHAYFYDGDGKRLALPWGPYSRKQEYDNHGNSVADIFLDIDDKIVVSEYGIAQINRKYIKNGQYLDTTEYLDSSGKLAMFSLRGYAKIKYLYNANGQLIEERYFDDQNKLISEKTNQLAVKKIRYEGNLLKTLSTYDAQGNLTIDNDNGASLVHYDYDKENINTKITYSHNNTVIKVIQRK